MGDINFLKNNSMIKSANSKKASSGLIKNLFIISLVVVVVGYVGCFGLNEFLKIKIKMTKTDLTEFNNVKQLNNEIKSYEQKINDISSIVDKKDENNVIQSDNLKLIGDLIPTDVSIQNYTIAEDKSITLQGISYNKDSIAYFIQKLKDSNVFNEASIQSIDSTSMGKDKNVSAYTFTIMLK